MIDVLEFLRDLKKQQLSSKVHEAHLTFYNFLKSDRCSDSVLKFFPDIDERIAQRQSYNENYKELTNPDIDPIRHQALIQNLKLQQEPFQNFDVEPDQVSQVKKTLNALYHIEQVFLGLEGMSLSGYTSFSTLSDASVGYKEVTGHLYKAIYLATHLDVDFQKLFQEELNSIWPIVNQLHTQAKSVANQDRGYTFGFKVLPIEKDAVIEKSKIYVQLDGSDLVFTVLDKKSKQIHDRIPLSEISPALGPRSQLSDLEPFHADIIRAVANREHIALKIYDKHFYATTAGEYTGIALNTLKPGDGKADFGFLTKVAGKLPEHISKWADKIKTFANKYDKEGSSIKPEQIDELREHSLRLLQSLDGLDGGQLLLPLKVINYIRILRHVASISMSIVEQSTNLSESSEELVCLKMSELKKLISQDLVGAVDKVEERLMLQPGSFSGPLKESLSQLYPYVLNIAGKVVDFKKKQPDLLHLDDAIFQTYRIDRSMRRQAGDKQNLLKLTQVKFSAQKFFNLLRERQGEHSDVFSLSPHDKQQLAKFYKAIQPFVLQLDAFSDSAFIDGLNRDKTFWDSFKSMVRTSDHNISMLLNAEDQVMQALDKKINTLYFNLELGEGMVKSLASQESSGVLRARKPDPTVNVINEEDVLKRTDISNLTFDESDANRGVESLENLSSEQARLLFGYYSYQKQKWEHTQQQFDTFMQIINSSRLPSGQYVLTEKKAESLKIAYGNIQETVVNFRGEEDYSEFDKLVVKLLKNKAPITVPSMLLSVLIKSNEKKFRDYIESSIDELDKRRHKYELLSYELYDKELSLKELTPGKPIQRKQYVLRNANISKGISEFRVEFKDYLKVFNSSVRQELKPNVAGVPFPDVENGEGDYAQSGQVMMLKRLMNAMYHMEETVKYLENLNEGSFQTTYAINVARAGNEAYNILHILKQLKSDPYASYMCNELLEKAMAIHGKTLNFIDPYLPEVQDEYLVAEPEDDLVESTETPIIKVSVLKALNALMIIPEHAKVVNENTKLTPEKIKECQDTAHKVAKDIQTIINDSNSFIKLVLDLPKMYGLYNKLSRKLLLATSSAHEAVHGHLEDICQDIIPEIMREGDNWEDKFGLEPGVITDPLQNITEAFVIRFLETLELPSKRHLALVDSVISQGPRIDSAKKRLESASDEIKKIKINEEAIVNLMGDTSQLKRLVSQSSSSPSVVESVERKLSKGLQVTLLPMILDMGDSVKSYGMEATQSIKQFEDFLDQNKKIDIGKVEMVLNECAYCLKSLDHSQQLRKLTIGEKLQYLEGEQSGLDAKSQQYELEYTQGLFQRYVTEYSEREFGLINLKGEYRESLLAHLMEHKDDIIEQSRKADDIRVSVKNMLAVAANEFEKRQFENYVQLSEIISALDGFSTYIRKSEENLGGSVFSVQFETHQTLKPKRELIDRLQDLARNQSKGKDLTHNQLSVDARIKAIQKEVGDVNFSITMKNYKVYDKDIFGWIKQQLALLMRAVGLYTPGFEKNMYRTQEAAENKKPISKYKNFNMFFKDPEVKRQAELKAKESKAQEAREKEVHEDENHENQTHDAVRPSKP